MPFLPLQRSRRRLRRLMVPTVVDVFFLVLLAASFATPSGLQSLLADGDTGWHIRTGELILASGRVPVADSFSFTRPGAPWFAWEWGSDVIFALLWRWKGTAAVAAFCGVAISLAAALLLRRGMQRGAGLAPALAATMAAVSASSIHYLARPHVFSILLYTVAIGWLQEDRVRPSRRVWLLVPLTAVWANLHAGFIAWCATLLLLVALSLADRDWARARRYTSLTAACVLASLANPYGWKLHRHVVEYLGSSWIMDHVQEFQSPSIRSEGMVVYALLLLAAVAAAARAERFEAALVVLWGFASLRSARHIPLFATIAAPLVAATAASWWERAAGSTGRRSAMALFREFSLDLGLAPRASAWLAVAGLAVMVSLPAAGFSDSRFPIGAVERNLALLTPAGPAPRVLTSDQWGDYLIFRLYPRQRVFFDGRSDFFGPALGADYRKLLAAEQGWRELLNRYRFELALLPHDWPLSTMLDGEPGWHRVYGDAVAVLYAREPANKAMWCRPPGLHSAGERRSPLGFRHFLRVTAMQVLQPTFSAVSYTELALDLAGWKPGRWDVFDSGFDGERALGGVGFPAYKGEHRSPVSCSCWIGPLPPHSQTLFNPATADGGANLARDLDALPATPRNSGCVPVRRTSGLPLLEAANLARSELIGLAAPRRIPPMLLKEVKNAVRS